MNERWTRQRFERHSSERISMSVRMHSEITTVLLLLIRWCCSPACGCRRWRRISPHMCDMWACGRTRGGLMIVCCSCAYISGSFTSACRSSSTYGLRSSQMRNDVAVGCTRTMLDVVCSEWPGIGSAWMVMAVALAFRWKSKVSTELKTVVQLRSLVTAQCSLPTHLHCMTSASQKKREARQIEI